MALVPGAGLNKEEVKYRQHEKCGVCTHFYYPNSCDIVDGNIAPDAVCNKWEIKPRDNQGRDKLYYDEEYQKSKLAEKK